MSLPLLLLGELERNSGFVTSRRAVELGCTRREIERWIKNGILRNLRRGIMSFHPAPDTSRGRNLELARAIAVAYDERLAISHESALLAHGLPTYGTDLRKATLVRINGGDTHTCEVVTIVRTRAELPWSTVDGVRVVEPAIAIAQVACEIGVEAAVVAADAAVHNGLITPHDVDQAASALGRCRGLPRAKQVAALVDGSSESPGETLTRLIATGAGVSLAPQVEIRDEVGDLVGRVDFLVEGTRRIVEFDGKMKYGSADDLYAEKRREDRLRALGYDVVRVVWADLSKPAVLAARLGRTCDQQAG